ncbi:MFS transporter [Paenibacillus sp. LHD-117]|uniref:MFS transporter n=1 Tax=Paenibacillus sp. LHD-117 TaxID=3071412 RepID=UPI0027DEEFDC|nr:MFS transporter [Paenibacillus sp. LHD-117]MDQ6418886.1 MFS transporter [Paenibacillus sp. LHD-117]
MMEGYVMVVAAARMWLPLKEKGFRRLFAGQVLSDFANWLDFIAISTLIVYGWGQGPMAMALFSLCVGIPWAVIGPLASVRMGRFSGRKVLISCDLLRAAIVLAMLMANSLGFMLALVFLKMSVSSVFDPVRQRAVKRLVDAGQLAQASSLSGLSVNLTKIIGPMVGGASALWIGGSAPFAIGAGLYALSALVLMGLPEWKTEERGSAGDRGGMRQALSDMATKPLLKSGILFMGLMFALIFIYDNLFVVLAMEAGLPEKQFGLLIGVVGAGSVVGALAAGHWDGWKRSPVARMAAAGGLSGFILVLVGLSGQGWLPVSLSGWLLAGALLGISGAQAAVPFAYILQTETTDDTIAPVSAAASAIQTGSILIAPSVGAAAAAYLGAGGVFIAAGLLMTAVGWLFWGMTAGGRRSGARAGGGQEAASNRVERFAE